MIKNFSKKIGTSDKIIVIIGNYSMHGYKLKGCESAISKKILRIFQNFSK